ncbi:MAG: hypothetical protein WA269_14425 [Candidatus Udaeobacter sp.]
MAHQITFTVNQIIKGEIHLWTIDTLSSEQSYRPLHFYRECEQSSRRRTDATQTSRRRKGCNALKSLTTGAANTGVGWYSLFSNTTGNFNMGVGAGALALNSADNNTAVGAGALFLNTTGSENTAAGANALVHNDSGSDNNAFGDLAMENNISGTSNTAIGDDALHNNVNGSSTSLSVTRPAPVWSQASITASRSAHLVTVLSSITSPQNNIVIGHLPGVSTTNGQVDDSCYIGNIAGAGVDGGIALFVFVDQDGKLGTQALPNTRALPVVQSQAVPQRPKPQAVPDAKQAKLNLKVEKLEARSHSNRNK